MANTVNITKILQGQAGGVSIFHVYLESDGASGDLADEVLISPSDIGLTSSDRFSVDCIKSAISGFTARVEFDSGLVEDNQIWVITEHADMVDFRPFGRLKDRSGVDGTGKLQITTTGFTSVGDQASLLIQVKS